MSERARTTVPYSEPEVSEGVAISFPSWTLLFPANDEPAAPSASLISRFLLLRLLFWGQVANGLQIGNFASADFMALCAVCAQI